MTQLPLPIALSERGEAERLLMTSANADAILLLRDWARWPSPATLLVGSARSGRSIMARLFAAESGGEVIDDADRCDEEQLFLRWNIARESGRPLLLVAQEAPPLWAVTLPDLRTRLATAAIARIAAPDESIAAALISHGLERAGSAFAPNLPEFIARRVTRCYETIDNVVAALNAESLSSGRKLTIATARNVLDASGLLVQDASASEAAGEGAETSG
jgi:hypothetical protein